MKKLINFGEFEQGAQVEDIYIEIKRKNMDVLLRSFDEDPLEGMSEKIKYQN